MASPVTSEHTSCTSMTSTAAVEKLDHTLTDAEKIYPQLIRKRSTPLSIPAPPRRVMSEEYCSPQRVSSTSIDLPKGFFPGILEPREPGSQSSSDDAFDSVSPTTPPPSPPYDPLDLSGMSNQDRFYAYLEQDGFIQLFSNTLQRMYIEEVPPDAMLGYFFDVIQNNCKAIPIVEQLIHEVAELKIMRLKLEDENDELRRKVWRLEAYEMERRLKMIPQRLPTPSSSEAEEAQSKPSSPEIPGELEAEGEAEQESEAETEVVEPPVKFKSQLELEAGVEDAGEGEAEVIEGGGDAPNLPSDLTIPDSAKEKKRSARSANSSGKSSAHSSGKLSSKRTKSRSSKNAWTRKNQ